MKKLISICIALLPLVGTMANDNLFADSTLVDSVAVDTLPAFILDDMTNAVVYQNVAITNLIKDRSAGHQRGQYQKSGFRVQVYSSNDSRVAKNEALDLYDRLVNKVDVSVYVTSDPPFWKVRLGDFETREEALNYKQLINQQFPELQVSTYVVPDTVTVSN